MTKSKRSHVVRVPVTDEELAEIEALAERERLSLAGAVRRAVHGVVRGEGAAVHPATLGGSSHTGGMR